MIGQIVTLHPHPGFKAEKKKFRVIDQKEDMLDLVEWKLQLIEAPLILHVAARYVIPVLPPKGKIALWGTRDKPNEPTFECMPKYQEAAPIEALRIFLEELKWGAKVEAIDTDQGIVWILVHVDIYPCHDRTWFCGTIEDMMVLTKALHLYNEMGNRLSSDQEKLNQLMLRTLDLPVDMIPTKNLTLAELATVIVIAKEEDLAVATVLVELGYTREDR